MATKRPNFLVIVADDLGFSDCGAFGGEIRTPAIDSIAKEGIRFTDFHAAAACSPTRSMIMTGTDHHIAGLGNLIEWTNSSGQNFPKGSKYSTAPQRGMPGYEGYLNERVVALPELLRDAGYHTMMSGKWHLGLTPERMPAKRGFIRSFALLPACSNHYNYDPERELGVPLPPFLEMSTICLTSRDGRYVEHDELPGPDKYYSSHLYGDQMVDYLKEWKELKEKETDKPFFAYLPFSAPHWPLQAPKEYRDHYRGIYDEGPEVLRQKRLKKLVELGLIREGIIPHPVVAEEVQGWDEMSEEEQKASCRAMEAYAGMVECLDANIQKVIDYLKSIDEYDNTFVMFLSDNGAEGAAYEAYPMVKGPLMEHIRKFYDNSLENIGNYNSFVWYGPRWAQAATAPSRLYKAYTTEGGVRVPCTVRFPFPSQRKAGGIDEAFATVMDISPTILEMAGVKHPAPTYEGREIVPMRGKSFLAFLKGEEERIHEKDFIQGWEICGRGAIRKGNWKADFIPKPKGTDTWQLYNLDEDPGETTDLAEKYPEKVEELLKAWADYCEACGVIPLQPELGTYILATEEQMPENAWMEYDYWRKGARDPETRDQFIKSPPKFKKPTDSST
ncbi:alkaline phosphatase-like protein [Atractiella rhizophila]|nr:alkaline phosphatase-like protein [Atractiella rhizophila]